ncbi:MAG: hypothetical protein OJJ54_12645 [Pseudonocardia sp.]|nr:hypothetical protein [Pseudonocardia sp.]
MSLVVALLLAGVGAGCFAVAAVLQHGAVGTQRAVGEGTPGRLDLAGLRELLRRRSWLLGIGLAGAGAGLHAAALVLAPVSVVQPVGVLAVPVAVLLALRAGGRPGPGVVAGIAACVGGVALVVRFAAAADPVRATGALPARSLLIAGALAVGVVLLLAVLAARTAARLRCLFCAVGGAVAFGLVAAIVRAVSRQLATGASTVVDTDVLVAAAGVGVALLVGGWLVQQAFASGPPAVVVAALTVVDPVVAVAIGIGLLGEGAGLGVGAALGMAGGAAVAAGGVALLARHHPDAAARVPSTRTGEPVLAGRP